MGRGACRIGVDDASSEGTGELSTLAPARLAATRFGWDRAAVRPVRRGHINETYFVAAPSGAFVLQRLNRSVFTDLGGLTANLLAVQRHVPPGLVPTPVATPAGEWLVRAAGGVWRAFERVRGAAGARNGHPGRRRTGGRPARPVPRRGRRPGPRGLDGDAARLPRPGGPARRPRARHRGRPGGAGGGGGPRDRPDPGDAVARRPRRRPHRGVPRRVAHYDAKLDNILFREGERSAWWTSTRSCPVLVLGRRRSPADRRHHRPRGRPRAAGVRVDPELYDRVLAGYRRAATAPRPTSSVEALEAAGAVVTYEQAVRFLTDWLAGDVYFQTTRPGQNLDRARTQLALSPACPARSGTVERTPRPLGPARPLRPSRPCAGAPWSSRRAGAAELDGALFAPDQPAVLPG